jgi:hypothetical protein
MTWGKQCIRRQELLLFHRCMWYLLFNSKTAWACHWNTLGSSTKYSINVQALGKVPFKIPITKVNLTISDFIFGARKGHRVQLLLLNVSGSFIDKNVKHYSRNCGM